MTIVQRIDRMLFICENDAMARCMRAVRDSCYYTAPECLKYRWAELSGIVTMFIPEGLNSAEEWKRKLIEMFSFGSDE